MSKHVQLRQVKQGDYFRLADTPTAPVWVREDYNRSTRKYECYKYNDINHLGEFNGTRLVVTDFIY